ncbi:MAG TPA: EAL domain-containing protein [Acidimicrobiia bacterium]
MPRETPSSGRIDDASFRAVADTTPMMIWVADPAGHAIWNNRGWYEFTGRAPEQELGQGWAEGIHPEDRERVLAYVAETFAARVPYEIAYRLRRHDGVHRWVVDTGVPRWSADGTFLGYAGSCTDVTDLVDTESERLLDRDRFRALIDHSFDLVSIYDTNGNFTFASPSHERVLGYPPEELIGTSPVDLLHPDDREAVAHRFAEQLLVTGESHPIEHRIRHRDGGWVWVESIAINLGDDPAVNGILVNARDVTDRRSAERLAAAQAGILELIARGAPLDGVLRDIVEIVEQWIPASVCAVVVIDDERDALRVASAPSLPEDAQTAISGFPAVVADNLYPEDVVVTDVRVNPQHPVTGEVLLRHGFRTWWGGAINDAEAQSQLGVVLVLRRDDATPTPSERTLLASTANLAAIAIARDRAQALLAHQASHDALTGLPNRELALSRLRRINDQPRKGGPLTAVLFLDIDRFKVLNDSVGHDAGDRLLIEMGHRLRDALRPSDLVARFGGDEFVMVCEQIGSEFDAFALASRVLDVVQEPFAFEGSEIVVTASIGIAMVGDESPEAVLRDADAAMYLAKDKGRARVEVFDDELRERVVARLDIERDLRKALDEGAFELHFQPVVSLVGDTLAGFEALLRWPHPAMGLLAPAAFLEIAEETGLIRPIGAWVRDEACRQAVAWTADHPEWGPFAVGVNLSPIEVRDRDLARGFEATLDARGLDPSLLVVEVGERLIIDDPGGARAFLTRLHDLGVQLALDDFGTGSAPLAHLRELPLQAIKIDGSLVSGLGRDAFDESLVDAVLDLTRRLDLFSVAEGVETGEQEHRLRGAGCMMAQGHHFGPPMPAGDVEKLLVGETGPIGFDAVARAARSTR